ncbi:MAG: mechanosensitive ion channel family protein [Candidatus Saccharimonadales bacterium]
METKTVNTSIEQTLQQMAGTIFSLKSIVVLLVSLTVAVIIGKAISLALRRLLKLVAGLADSTTDSRKADMYRRRETILVLSIALIRTVLVVFALYFWWVYLHPNQQPTAIIGASALFVVLASATLGPVLRDLSAGSVMMAEQWYGVGDHVTFEPFLDLKGVVERVTLRSTKVRGLNGEIIWLNNQHIQGVRIAPRGVRTIAIDIFVSNLTSGKTLVDDVSSRIPRGKLMLAAPLKVSDTEKLSKGLWRITAIAQTAPGREWLIEKLALEMLKEADDSSKTSVIVHGPVARYADPNAERRFARAVRNS